MLTRRDVISFHTDQISEWKPESEMWPFKYGVLALSGLASISAININRHFIKRFKLRPITLTATIVGIGVAPAVANILLHAKCVSDRILALDDICPLCSEGRAVLVQGATSVVYPVILAPLANMPFALNAATVRIPEHKNVRLFVQFLSSIIKPIYPTLLVTLAINGVAASIVTYFEVKTFHHMRQVMKLKADEYEEQQAEESFFL